jgi:hypothetical protein
MHNTTKHITDTKLHVESSHGSETTCNIETDSQEPRSSFEGESPLPCLFRNNSIERDKIAKQKSMDLVVLKQIAVGIKYRKTSVALSHNVQEFASKYGLSKLGFLTLTFKDHITDVPTASKRFNSLATNVLNSHYKAWLKVMERQKSGRIHYHLIVAMDFDVRENFDFAAVSNNDYSTANQNLRSEWSFWRSTAKKYGFGRTELLPIKSSQEAIGRYVGKYIGKHMMRRKDEDKGARLVSYSKGSSVMNTKFSWVTEGAAIWRTKVKSFAYFISERTGCEPTFEGLREELGPKWAYNHREFIAMMPVGI